MSLSQWSCVAVLAILGPTLPTAASAEAPASNTDGRAWTNWADLNFVDLALPQKSKKGGRCRVDLGIAPDGRVVRSIPRECDETELKVWRRAWSFATAQTLGPAGADRLVWTRVLGERSKKGAVLSAVDVPASTAEAPPPPNTADAVEVTRADLSVRRRVNPTYPDAAKSMKPDSAQCTMRVFVDESGTPFAVEPMTCPPVFVAPTTEAFMGWRWFPEMRDGKAIAVSTELTVTYKLEM